MSLLNLLFFRHLVQRECVARCSMGKTNEGFARHVAYHMTHSVKITFVNHNIGDRY
jgi:hypothetical protein